MNPSRILQSERSGHGDVLTAISDGMVAHQQDPDMMCEVFILAPTDLVDDHEIPGSGASANPI
jgi:hypothetical protein